MDRNALAWVNSEVRSAAFGDKRLDSRFEMILSDCLKNPGAPLNQVSASWSEAKAAYRFMQNKKVSPDKILMPHVLQTVKRAHAHDTILMIQDSTGLNFNSHKATDGLGEIGHGGSHQVSSGLFLHSAYCLDTAGNPLGFIFQKTWIRKPERKLSRVQQSVKGRQTAFEDKSSVRWVESLEAAHNSLTGKTNVIAIGDRESDIFELYSRCTELGQSFIVRARNDRLLSDLEDFETFKASEIFDIESPVAYMSVLIRGNGTRSPREAKVAIYARQLEMSEPQRKRAITTRFQNLEAVELSLLWVVEEDPPKGCPPINWMLFTDLTVEAQDQAMTIVRWYSFRWRIEEIHKILKSGCKVEDCRLETRERLENFIALKLIVAHRLCELTFRQRKSPDEAATAVFSDEELECLHFRLNPGKPLPKTPPSLRQVTRQIAQLGGFLGRKGDGEPGIITLWRGWQLFEESYAMYCNLKSLDPKTYG